MVHFPHKIVVPHRPAHLVRRPRLTTLLQAIAERRLITLSAPAGYGKTSLLTDFAASNPPMPICWYTLDRFDEDPWAFLGYLAAALEQRFPGSTDGTAKLLTGSSRSAFESVASMLVREAYAIEHDFALVIDDWHLVDHVTEITELVAQLLLHCPNCHLILASRIYPSLPDMMLLAARREMSGLDEDELRFTAPEISEVLGAECETTIAMDQAELLAEQTNGWIAGILLAFQATGPDTPSLAPRDKRAERQIYGFLAEQVLDQQPPEVRTFLLDSSLLEELTPEHCDELLARTDSGPLLQTLRRHHLFVSEIRSGVLRYHPLFREFLQEHYRTFDTKRFRAMALQVAQGYAAEEHWSIAFDLCLAVGDLAAARQVVAAGGEQLFGSGRLETIELWLAALPMAELDASLLCLKARVLLRRGRPEEARALADMAETRMGMGDEAVVLLVQIQIARVSGQYAQALEIAQHVLDIADDVVHRAGALREAAICYQRLGQSELAIEGLKEALALERQRGDPCAVAALQHDLGIYHEETGQLELAAEHYGHADAYWALIGNLGLRAMTLNSKGVVQHLMGNYRDAYATLVAALQYAQDASVPDYQATVLTSLGDLYSDLQLWQRANAAYTDAEQAGGSAFLTGYLELAHVRLLVRQHEYETASLALRRLAEAKVSHDSVEIHLLEATCAWGLRAYETASSKAQQALGQIRQTKKPMALARARLLQAQIAADASPLDNTLLLGRLDQAAVIADELGHDAFLVAETLHLGGLLRRAHACGWSRAESWLQRHQDMLAAAQALRYDDARPLLVVRALGLDQILLDGQILAVGWLKAREVFYYLLAHPYGATPDAIREAIWPELGLDSSRNALKTAIYQLRAVLPSEMITLQGRQLYVLDRERAHIDYDVEQFLAILDNHQAHEYALYTAFEAYQGPFLPWSDNAWSAELRQYYLQRYVEALRLAAEKAEQEGACLDALALFRRLLSVDNLDEAAHAGVMRCQVVLGNRAAAISQYQILRRAFDEELGLELGQGSEVEQIYSRILAIS